MGGLPGVDPALDLDGEFFGHEGEVVAELADWVKAVLEDGRQNLLMPQGGMVTQEPEEAPRRGLGLAVLGNRHLEAHARLVVPGSSFYF